MEIKILQVFYGKDGLPYKDKERQVHFPIAGTGFLGASNTTKIKFYYDELDNLDETSWVAVSKLPNGKVGSRVLESYLDEELNEHYALLELDNYYTQYKGDVFISLQGYQGGVDFDYDEENSQYEIHGTPTIAATGSIKFTINYANQFVGSGQTDNINFQRILAALGTKLGMRAYSEYVEELPSQGSPDVFYVIKDEPSNPNLANIYIWNENTKHYIWVGDNSLYLGNYYTKAQGEVLENRVGTLEGEIPNIINGAPRGTYVTIEDLEDASPQPSHDYIYLILEGTLGGHWVYWNETNSEWTDGGEYLSTGDAVPNTRKVAGITLENDITIDALLGALNVEDRVINKGVLGDLSVCTIAINSAWWLNNYQFPMGVIKSVKLFNSTNSSVNAKIAFLDYTTHEVLYLKNATLSSGLNEIKIEENIKQDFLVAVQGAGIGFKDFTYGINTGFTYATFSQTLNVGDTASFSFAELENDDPSYIIGYSVDYYSIGLLANNNYDKNREIEQELYNQNKDKEQNTQYDYENKIVLANITSNKLYSQDTHIVVDNSICSILAPFKVYAGITYYYYHIWDNFSCVDYGDGEIVRFGNSGSADTNGSFTPTKDGLMYISLLNDYVNNRSCIVSTNKQMILLGLFFSTKKPKVYYVEQDGSGDFTTIKAAIEEATKYMDSIVYIGTGTYDLISEFGADIENISSSNRGLYLKNRIHLIGASNSKITMNYTGNTENVCTWAAIFNTGKYGFIIENLTLEGSNIRYLVHDEKDADADAYISKYKNCTMVFDNRNNQYAYSDQCIGGGLGTNGYIEIDGCYFDTKATTGCEVSYHNTSGSGKSHIVVKNSYFAETNGHLRVNWYGASTEKTPVIACGNSFGKAIESVAETPESTNQNIEITQFNNELRKVITATSLDAGITQVAIQYRNLNGMIILHGRFVTTSAYSSGTPIIQFSGLTTNHWHSVALLTDAGVVMSVINPGTNQLETRGSLTSGTAYEFEFQYEE